MSVSVSVPVPVSVPVSVPVHLCLCIRVSYRLTRSLLHHPLPLPSQELVLTINSFNILICIFRLFKYYEFQDRLNILTRTFGEAWSGLVG